MAISFRISLLAWIGLLLAHSIGFAQTPQYPPFPAGMRLLVGQPGVLPRNTPSLTGTCGKDSHECTPADAVPPGQYGVVQNNPPVFDPAGWWWIFVIYENGMSGWSSGYPPFLNQLSPPQMAQGFPITIVGDYLGGPILTQATCILDGISSAATMNLQPSGTGQTGLLICPWTTSPGVGNHKAVITAINAAGSTPSTEFQFAVTAVVVPMPPLAPSNLRIAPQNTTSTTTKTAVTAEKPKK